MDYPFLNLVFGLVLVFTNFASIALAILLSEARIPRTAWRAILFILILSLLPSLYIDILLFRSTLPALNSQMCLGILLIGGLVAILTAVFSRIPVSRIQARVLLALLLAGILANFALAYLLYRSLVPNPIF